MASAGDVTINFAAETAKFTAEMKKVRTELKSLRESTDGIVSSLKGFGTALKSAFLAAGVVAGIRAIVKATEESDAAVAQLESALKSAGTAVRISSSEFQTFAKSLQATTVFTDEAILGVSSLLLSFRGLSGDTVEKATAAVLDLSTRLGTDLNSSAKLVGRALADPEKGLTALTRAGVIFSATQKAVIKNLIDTGDKAGAQGVILQELEKRFGGAASAARDTFGGALKGLSNAFGDLFEGDKNSFKGATASINALTKALNDPKIKEGFDNLISAAAATLSVTARLAIALTNLGRGIGSVFAPSGADLKASEALTLELKEQQRILAASERQINPTTQKDLAIMRQQVETLKQRIELAKEIETIAERTARAQGIESVSVSVSRIGTDDDSEAVFAKLKHQTDLLDIRQRALTASIASSSADLDLLDKQLGDGEKRRTELDEIERKNRDKSRADFAKDQLDIATEEFDRRLALEQQFTAATIEENRKRVAVETAARLEETKVRQDAVIKSIAVLGFLVSGHKSANKAIELANKAATIKQIIIDTKGAVMATLKYFGGTPWGYAAAAAVAGFGALQVAGVLKADSTFSVGSSPNFTTPAATAPGTNVSNQDTQSGRVLQVYINGPISGPDSARWLVDQLKDLVNNDDVVIFSGNSRQSQTIRGG